MDNMNNKNNNKPNYSSAQLQMIASAFNAYQKKQDRKKTLKKFLIFLAVVVTIVVAFIGIRKLVSYIQLDIHDQELAALSGLEFNYDEYIEEIKNTPSDIEGMTQYDKYEMGLKIANGSDSDYDGLTDKEEIEVYNTDPLNASTAGDLYTDGYKVKHDMDLFSYCDYQGKKKTKHVKCTEVSIDVDSPTEFYTVVEDATSRYSLDSFGIVDIYKGYNLYNYTGKITIDVSEIMKSKKIECKDMSVWVFTGDFIIDGQTKCEKVSFDIDGTSITPNYEFNHSDAYYVYIGQNESFGGTIKRFFANIITDETKSIQVDPDESLGNGRMLYMGFTIPTDLGAETYDLYYIKGEEDLLTDALAFMKKEFVRRDIDFYNNSRVHALSKEEYNAMVDFIKNSGNPFWLKDMTDNVWSTSNFQYLLYKIYEYDGTKFRENPEYIYDGEGGDLEDAVELKAENGTTVHVNQNYKKYDVEHTTFQPYEDELPFGNFGSYISEQGNCAGISHLTAYLFNNSTYSGKGEYNGIKWNVKKYADTQTLLDPGLYDYKNSSFVSENKKNGILDEDFLNDDENEFVKMIGTSLEESNDRIGCITYADGQEIPYSTIDKITAYLDQGKILEAGMYMANGTGHAVNIYDYYYNPAGEIIFRVYDSNLPQDQCSWDELSCVGGCYLQGKKVINEAGEECFKYLYAPLASSKTYYATNYYNLQPDNGLTFWDDQWNIFE